MRFIVLAAAACLTVAPASFARDTTPPPAADAATQTHQLAARYLEIGGNEQAFTDAVYSTLRGIAQAHGTHATDDQWRRIHELVVTDLTPAGHQFVGELTDYYATHYTREDLQAAVDFYQSPPGAHYVQVALGATSVLLASFASAGAMPLPEPPPVAALDATKLEHARALAAVLGARITPLEAERMNAAGFSVERFSDYFARYFANNLSLEDIDASTAWANSPASQRVEGQSADRSEAIQLATAHIMRNFDLAAVGAHIRTILSEAPT